MKKKMLSKDEAESLTLIQKFSPKNRSIFEKYIKKKKMIEIDAPVTSDIHRLIRAPYSVHGKSGLSKIPVQDVDLFNPFSDPVLLSRRKITAKISYMPKTIFIDNGYDKSERPIFTDKSVGNLVESAEYILNKI